MKEIEALGEQVSVAAPSLTEVLIGAHFNGGALLGKTVDLASRLEVLPIDDPVAAEAGRLGAELLRRGHSLPTTNLLIAGAARLHRHILVTRDEDFQRIPGLAVEGY